MTLTGIMHVIGRYVWICVVRVDHLVVGMQGAWERAVVFKLIDHQEEVEQRRE